MVARLMPCDSRTGQALMGGPELGYAAQAATAHRPSVRHALRCVRTVQRQQGDRRAVRLRAGRGRAAGLDRASGLRLRHGPHADSGRRLLEMLVIDDEISRWIRWSLEERPADESVLDVAGHGARSVVGCRVPGASPDTHVPSHREGAEQALVPGHARELERRRQHARASASEGRGGAGSGAGGA